LSPGNPGPGAGPSPDREERIRRRAYELWENDGHRHGADEAHWHEATRQIDGEDAGTFPGGEPPGPGAKDPAEGSREVVDSNLSRTERDAQPQFARTRFGSRNSGVVSAEPRVISEDESGDATFPLNQDSPGR
jgi:hypothetical protein